MTTRQLIIAGSQQKARKRTFIAQAYGTSLNVFEWTRSGVSLQSSITGLGTLSRVQFSPAENAVAVVDGGNTKVFSWDKTSGIGSQLGSTFSGGFTDFSPAGDALLAGANIYAFSGSGIGSLIDTSTLTGSLKFSQSGNYIVAATGSSIDVEEWNVSTGVGSVYSSGFINIGPTRADMSVDDSHIISLNNSGTLRLHSFNGSSISLTASSSIGTDSAYSIVLNNRMDKILLAADDQTVPQEKIRMYSYTPGVSIGSAYTTPSYVSVNAPDNAVFSASNNVVAFTQIGNFVIAKATSDGWGSELYSDTASGAHYTDIIEVDA